MTCDQGFELLKEWALAQPNSIQNTVPTPSPEEVLAEEVIDGHYFVETLDFPKNSFLQYGKGFAHVKSPDGVHFWLKINDSFESLMAVWRENLSLELDSHVKGMLEDAKSGRSLFSDEEKERPEYNRVKRKFSKFHNESEDEKWEPSQSYSAIARVSSCRTYVPVMTEEAHFGWEMEIVALYQKGKGLVFINPISHEIDFIGSAETELPSFLKGSG